MYEFLDQDKNEFKGCRVLRIETNRIYQLYKYFMRNSYPSSKARNIDTMMKEISKLGILKYGKRRSVNKSNRYVVDICYDVMKRNLNKLYPTLEVGDWDSETDAKEFDKYLNTIREGLFG